MNSTSFISLKVVATNGGLNTGTIALNLLANAGFLSVVGGAAGVPTGANLQIIFASGLTWYVTESIDQIVALFPNSTTVAVPATAL